MHWKSKCPPGDLPEVPSPHTWYPIKNNTQRIQIVVTESMIILSHLPLPDTDRDETSLFRKQPEPFTFPRNKSALRTFTAHRTPPQWGRTSLPDLRQPGQLTSGAGQIHTVDQPYACTRPESRSFASPDHSGFALFGIRYYFSSLQICLVLSILSSSTKPALNANRPTHMFRIQPSQPIANTFTKEWLNTERPRKHDDTLFQLAAQFQTIISLFYIQLFTY